MRCLIDTTVHNALKYYSTYLWEPSPQGDIAIGPKEISATGSLDLQTVLAEMKALGAKGEMLVVTHSNQEGFMMKLIGGGKVSAGFREMDKILEISDGIREKKAIAAVPASGRAQAWQRWFKKFDPGIKLEDGFEVGNDGWEQAVERWYDQWHARQGEVTLKLPKGRGDLDDFIKLVEDVRKQGFARLEFRACDIGTNLDPLKSAARFFGVGKLVAPRGVFTFYSSTSSVKIVAAAKLEAMVKKAAPNVRTFKGTKLVLFAGPRGFDVHAPAEGEGKAFIKGYIRSDYKGGEAPFVAGGLQPVGKNLIPGMPYVFPLEKEYKGFLVTASP